MALARRPDAYLLELGVGLAILAALNVVVLPRDPGFLAVQPHPALLVVAIVAVRHGLREGIVSAATTGGLVLACSFARAETVTVAVLGRLSTYATPLLALATAVVLGALSEIRRREGATLARRVATLEQELADQAVRFMASAEARHELERRVAEESASLSHLYTAARAMETLDLEQLYPAIALTLRRFLHADAGQLYVLDGSMLHLRAADGSPPPSAELPIDDGLPGLAVRRAGPVSVRDYMTVASLDELRSAPILLAAPLTGRDGALLGCLTVTRLPFLKLTPATLERLGVVADWAARALENARIHERTVASTITDELVRAYTYAYFQRRLAEEEARADRFGRPLSVIVFRILALELVRPERRPDLARLLGRVFSRALRSIDLVCRYATEDSFAILLPETPGPDAGLVAERLAREIRDFHFLPYTEEERELEFTTRVLVVRPKA